MLESSAYWEEMAHLTRDVMSPKEETERQWQSPYGVVPPRHAKQRATAGESGRLTDVPPIFFTFCENLMVRDCPSDSQTKSCNFILFGVVGERLSLRCPTKRCMFIL